MNTSVTMVRRMGDLRVEQRTKDGMFNATTLLSQYNEKVNTHNNGELKHKDLDDYLSNKSTKEYIKALMNEPEFADGQKPYQAVRGKHGGTFMSPLMFIDFCMWLSPEFKITVLKFVSDQMIEYRNEAGDAYKRLSKAVNTLQSRIDIKSRMKWTSEALNILTFGQHSQGERNQHGTVEEMKNLLNRETIITTLIEDGFIKSFEQLQAYLRNAWSKEHGNPIAQLTVN